MSSDICKAIFRKLATDGTVFTPNVFRTLKATYYRTAFDMFNAYYDDAKMNGLNINRHEEEKAIELFAANLMQAGLFFLKNPQETPFIPTWNRVHAADPGITHELRSAVAEDAAEFTWIQFRRSPGATFSLMCQAV